MAPRVKNSPVDGTSFEFLKVGWWILHALAIPLVFYLGHIWWP